MKISGSFILMLVVWVLAFTHFLGGPYILFKIIFWIALFPYIFATLFFIWMLLKARKIMNFGNKINNSQTQETIHVESTIKE
jgi:cytosine/uracil/thiamine/allantoin permease